MKSMIRLGFTILICLTIFSHARADDAAVKAATATAEEWLALVDGGEYNQSWETAASYFKGVVDKGQWEKMMTGGRAPLGKLVSRRVDSAKYTEDLPGAPDGKYVVIQFKTSFENKKSAYETVTPMLDNDGQWRVSGYYIR